MRIIIIGAGSLGTQLAHVLHQEHEVVVVDYKSDLLEQLRDHIDVMTVNGNGATAYSLLNAEVEKADVVLAVTSKSEANILACNLAKCYNVTTKVARVRSMDFFDEQHNLTAEYFGVDFPLIPEQICANEIIDTILRPGIKETVALPHPHAQLVNFSVGPASPMANVKLIEFPRKDLLEHVRICAILRYGHLVIPRGETTIYAHDEVYVAGEEDKIDELVGWATFNSDFVTKVIISGYSQLTYMLATKLQVLDMRVVIVEPDSVKAQKAAEELGRNILIIHGDASDARVLNECHIEHCDVFIGAHHENNEHNILSCLLAKRLGTKRVYAVTNNSDFIRIIAGMSPIDCGFSPIIAAANQIIRQMKTEFRRTIALLQRMPAEILELQVLEKSEVENKRIHEIDLPRDMVIGLIIRDEKIVPAVGDAMFHVGDKVVVLAKTGQQDEVDKVFRRRGFLG
ncbi:MAG: Trk system potassium transporter TrkA [Lentisphaeria bacterium]|nr:Trk system potassium transporter TrkA [Lentisphaeria bacterium]